MKNNQGPLFVITAAVLWGVDGIVLRPYLYDLPVNIVVLLESSLVALILTPFMIKKTSEIKSLTKKDWAAFAGVALFGGAIGTLAITKALFYVNFVNLSIVILIQKLQPVFAILFASLFLKERPGGRFFIWSGIAVASAYLMTFGLNVPVFDSNDKTAIAALFALVAAASFALSTVMSKRALKNTTFFTATYMRFALSALIMIFISFFFMNFGDVSQLNQTHIIVFIIIAFSTGGAAIFLYYYGLKKISASSSSIYELSFPLSAVLLEYILRDNILSPIQWIAVVILFYSIFRVNSLNSANKD
ncbi:MAG: membrane protein [Melioribacteraceae bacterium]|nr:MAG: membrane protein [Melioribacteraceae bacterium]